MKLKWMGMLSKTNPFPSPVIPSGSKELFKGRKNWHIYMLTVPILLGAYFCIILKRSLDPEMLFSKGGLFLGVGLTLLFLSVHELIHAACCPKRSEILVYASFAGLCLIPTSPMGKNRYIVMAIMPTFLLGVCPLAAWMFLTDLSPIMNSVIFTFSLGNLGTCIGDIYNVILATSRMTRTSLLITSGSGCYYYEK